MQKTFFFLFVIFCLSSCIQIVEDISFNSDGSGRVKYTLNASESKAKIDAILLLDSLQGYKVPSMQDFKKQLIILKDELVDFKGVRSVSYNFDEDLFKISFTIDFNNVETLTEIQHKFMEDSPNIIDYSFKNNSFNKMINYDISHQKLNNNQDLDKAVFIGIVRFKNEIESFSNSQSTISEDKKALMLKTTLNNLVNNPQILNNQIIIK